VALAHAYKYPAFYEAQKNHQWGTPGQEQQRGLYGKTMGIIGMGNTGKELAVRAKAFGMKVLGYKRSVAEPAPGVDRLYCRDAGETLDALLQESDFVALALPLSDTSHHLIGERELGLMKPSACLINLARGAVIDEEAMLSALRKDTLGLIGHGVIVNDGDAAFAAAFGALQPAYDADGGLMYTSLNPGYTEAIGWFRKLYQEGILSKEFAVMKTMQAEKLYQTGRAASYVRSIWYDKQWETAIEKSGQPKPQLANLTLKGPKAYAIDLAIGGGGGTSFPRRCRKPKYGSCLIISKKRLRKVLRILPTTESKGCIIPLWTGKRC
jgi:hypothetical protein